jgi:hypothetical protein
MLERTAADALSDLQLWQRARKGVMAGRCCHVLLAVNVMTLTARISGFYANALTWMPLLVGICTLAMAAGLHASVRTIRSAGRIPEYRAIDSMRIDQLAAALRNYIVAIAVLATANAATTIF